MASAATTATADHGSIQSNSVPIVDLRLLSQSELFSLSLFSPPPSFCDDVVIPTIDRSVFNESVGSRKQTYSRLRLAPPSSSATGPRRRTPHLRSTANFSNNANSDPENAENGHIVKLLKQLFVPDTDPGELVHVKLDYTHSHSLLPQQLISNVSPTGQKRKRGRPRKDGVLKEREMESRIDVSVDVNDNVAGFPLIDENVLTENVEYRDKELLNRDGLAVDLVILGGVEHPFWDEIRRRTEGLRTEEELLGFLRGLNGQWGSTRRKRRIVEASEFGNALPVGWKLLLAIKKKTGHLWLYCRRYISPSGRQFVSCKEVSSYLLSLHGVQDSKPHPEADHSDADQWASVPIADIASQNDAVKESIDSHTSSPGVVSSPGETLHCKKCDVTFNEKVEFLTHQSTFHIRNRYRNAVSLTDGVIIKNGKYECQFCHKTFTERHRYNGHIGAHVRYQAKMAGELPAGGTEGSGDLVSFSEFPIIDAMVESEKVSEIINASINSGQDFPPHDKEIDPVEDLKETTDNMRGIEEATDLVTANIQCSVAEVSISCENNKGFHEASDHARVDGCTTEIVADRNGLLLPSDEKIHVANGVIKNFDLKPKQDKVPEISSLDSNNCVEECDIVVHNRQSCQTSNELKLDGKNFAVTESIFEFFESHDGQGKDIGNTTHTPNNDKSCSENKVHSIAKSTADESSFGTSKKGVSKTENDFVSGPKEMQFGINSITPSWNDQETLFQNHDDDVSACLFKEPNVQNTSEINGDDVLGGNMAMPKFGGLQNFSNGELSEQDRKLGAYTAFASSTEKQYCIEEDNINRVFDLEEHKQDPSGSVLFTQSGVSEVPSAGYTANTYATPANQSKINEVESTENYGLSLSFGNFQTEQHLDSTRFEQERYQPESYNIPSIVEKTYGDQSIINSNIPSGPKQSQNFGIDLFDSSFHSSHEIHSNFNNAPSGWNWNGLSRDTVGNSGQNIMAGFGNSSSQSAERAIANGSWTAGGGNIFHGFDGASNPQVQGSSFFRTFNLASDKGQGSSGVNEIHPNISTTRNNPVEYSFMGNEQSSNSRPRESQIFSYNENNIEQGLNPSFWLGRDALMHNTSSNQVTSVCVWCRNVFYHEPVQPGIQTGSIGSMCPSCSSRMPGQFNVL